MPPIIAYHIVFGAYGFWLPNDPRGSWSTTVRALNLVPFGPPIPANTRRSRAPAPHDHKLRFAAKAALKYPAVRFTQAQIQCVAAAFGGVGRDYCLPCYAAAIMPDHVHMVIARQAQTAEAWTGYFKRAASRALRTAGLHPFADRPLPGDRLPTPWAEGGWRVYLHTPQEIRHRMRYVEQNPIHAGLSPQHWDFITIYAP